MQIVIAPVNQADSGKNWPHYDELILRINEELHCVPILVGTKKEGDIKKSQCWKSMVFDRMGRTILDELEELIKQSDLVICNEGGIGHLCVEPGVRAIVILNKPQRWGALRNENINLYKPSVEQVFNMIKLCRHITD